LHLLPTLWCRNTWAWGRHEARPVLMAVPGEPELVHVEHPVLGTYWLACEGAPSLLFTDNETNSERLWGVPNQGRVKDGINDAIVGGRPEAVARDGAGTKVAAHYERVIAPGATEMVWLRLSAARPAAPFAAAAAILAEREREADA